MLNIAIIGSSGSIGNALTNHLSVLYPNSDIHAFSRTQNNPYASNVRTHILKSYDEEEMMKAAHIASADRSVDLTILATGMLHDGDIMPEKSLRDISAEKLRRIYEVNTILPALSAKHFLPVLNKNSKSVFAALSARVGSIGDNQLGGWYAYRASKTALNMIIKCASIEMARLNRNAIVIGLHPGTVDSPLSRPFQSKIAAQKLFSPQDAAEKLVTVINNLSIEHSGKCFAWDGQEIEP